MAILDKKTKKAWTEFGFKTAEEAVKHYDFVMDDFSVFNSYRGLTREEYQNLMKILKKARDCWASFNKDNPDIKVL